jgi:chromosome segregation ATPase
MRPADFTDEMIIEAGKRLTEQGRKVTGYGLRNELGGGESKRLISVWKRSADQDAVETLPETELPPELEELLSSTSQSLLTHLRSITVSIHQSATKAADRQVAEITRQFKELEEQTEAELKDAEVIIEKLESDKNTLRCNLAKTEEYLESARKEVSHYERKVFELETQLKEMKSVEGLIQRLEALEKKAAENSGVAEAETPLESAHGNGSSEN